MFNNAATISYEWLDYSKRSLLVRHYGFVHVDPLRQDQFDCFQIFPGARSTLQAGEESTS